MTTLKSKQAYSRRKARRLVKEIYPDLPRHKIVHHVDLNPLNNDINNFAIMSNSEHFKLHWLTHPETMGNTKSILKDLEYLESWLIFYNNTYALTNLTEGRTWT